MNHKLSGMLFGAIVAACLSGSMARATFWAESEPNDGKAQATLCAGMVSGDTMIGATDTSAGPGLDYFRIRTASAPLGIYRHRLVVESQTPGHVGTIRGLDQSAGAPGTVDRTLQTTSTITTPARFNQWYGFGKAEELYYRITGTSTTTMAYTVTLETTPIVPINLGILDPGPNRTTPIMISTIDQGHATDTDMWVYDSNFNPIAGYGNDDMYGSALSQSILMRPYDPGVYYLALSNFNLANNQPSPADDDFRGGNLLDFPNAIVNSSYTPSLSLNLLLQDQNGPRTVTATKPGSYGILWARFEVVPEPSSIMILLAGLFGLSARRRCR